ncbi:MAG: RNA methyltransferase [Verrucomicrobia bacterium]|nr:MAG: RNA methyltransferase [Verrucomicrobiota bacterium]
MPTDSAAPALTSPDAWPVAARLLVRWLDEEIRADALLDTVQLSGGARARCQNLFYGAIRHYGRIESVVATLVRLRPRSRVMAVLLLSGYELIEGGGEGHTAKVGHHAVTQTKALASPSEARLVNAVVRKLGDALAAQTTPGRVATAAALANFFSTPEWLVERWLAHFGAEGTRALLEWNLKPAQVHARWRLPSAPGAGEAAWLEATAWPEYYLVKSGHWGEVARALADGRVYLADPGTRLAIEAAAPRPGERIIDACAAPGGKSVALADRMGEGLLVALDVPGARQDRLAENLKRVPPGVSAKRVEGDLRRASSLMGMTPGSFDVVLVDAPCTNSGVIRHRVDVKWRLQPTDFAKHAKQQVELLASAARWLKPGGRLVYSTCSIDTEENEGVVAAFLRVPEGASFKAERTVVALPWQVGHDGAGVCVLRKQG